MSANSFTSSSDRGTTVMPESRYLRLLYGLVIGLLAVVIAFDWLVDPFSLFGAPQVRGFNANKPGYVDHLRLTHVYRVERLKPDCILIGTSRTGRGLRPDHASLVAHDCYNLALPAISIYEMRRYLQHAQAVRSLEHVVPRPKPFRRWTRITRA